MLWGVTGLFIKLSILHSYRQLLGRTFRTVCKMALLVVCTDFILYTTILVLSCIPIATNWPPAGLSSCIPLHVGHTVTASLNFGVNLIILLLPVSAVSRLDLPVNNGIFAAGILVVGAW